MLTHEGPQKHQTTAKAPQIGTQGIRIIACERTLIGLPVSRHGVHARLTAREPVSSARVDIWLGFRRLDTLGTLLCTLYQEPLSRRAR